MLKEKKVKRSDIIHTCMTLADHKEVAILAARVIGETRSENIPNQLMAVATVLIAMEEKYGIKTIEAINAAENLIDSVKDSEESSYFSILQNFMLSEWND